MKEKINFIDLCLPSGTLWADRNVGAETLQDYGDYFNFEDAQKCGTLPARWQMCELVDCTKHEVCEVESVRGMRFTGKNENSIFVPFAGYLFSGGGSLVNNVGYYGYLWSCTPNDGSAYSLYFNYDSNIYLSGYNRNGLSVRLIQK